MIPPNSLIEVSKPNDCKTEALSTIRKTLIVGQNAATKGACSIFSPKSDQIPDPSDQRSLADLVKSSVGRKRSETWHITACLFGDFKVIRASLAWQVKSDGCNCQTRRSAGCQAKRCGTSCQSSEYADDLNVQEGFRGSLMAPSAWHFLARALATQRLKQVC